MLVVLARNWWTLVLRGVLAILFGVAAFAWPGLTLGALILLFAAYAIVDGIFAIVAAVVGRTGGMPWWAMLVQGLIGPAAGIAAVAMPGITALVLLYLIAGWAVMTGILVIVAAIRLRREIQGEWMLVLGGLLSVLVGIGLAAFPGAGALAVVWYIGAFAIVSGVLQIALGLRLRGWHRETRLHGSGAMHAA